MVCAVAVGCGDGPSTPTAPTPPSNPTPTPPAPTYTLSGRVTENPFTAVSGATVAVVDGANAGKTDTTDPAGSYKLSGLTAATFDVKVSASGYETKTVSVTLAADQTVDIELTRSPSQ